MISILVASRNRPERLKTFVKNLVITNFSNYELVIIDQSHDRLIQFPEKSTLRYFHRPGKGKSTALNYGLELVGGEIIAFTDDDCIVSPDWLTILDKSFKSHQEVVGVFGQILPHRPMVHRGEICPSCFTKTQKSIISQPCFHREKIGFGNNMALRKWVFEKYGYFKTWLGPGSKGQAAEDAELSLRLLRNNEKILYNPQAIVYHDKWLSKKDSEKLDLQYIKGEVSCYSYLAKKKNKVGFKVIILNLKNLWIELIQLIKSGLENPKENSDDFKRFIKKTEKIICGLWIGLTNN